MSEKSTRKRKPINFIGSECTPMSPEQQARWDALMRRLIAKHGPAMIEYAKKQQAGETNPA